MYNEIHAILMTFVWFDLCGIRPLICADPSYMHRSSHQPWALKVYEKYQGVVTVVTVIYYIYTLLPWYLQEYIFANRDIIIRYHTVHCYCYQNSNIGKSYSNKLQ